MNGSTHTINHLNAGLVLATALAVLRHSHGGEPHSRPRRPLTRHKDAPLTARQELGPVDDRSPDTQDAVTGRGLSDRRSTRRPRENRSSSAAHYRCISARPHPPPV
jgi:hypothetical protein